MNQTIRQHQALKHYSLSEEMKKWLGSQSGNIRFDDFILMFRAKFELTPEQTGELLGCWSRVKWKSI